MSESKPQVSTGKRRIADSTSSRSESTSSRSESKPQVSTGSRQARATTPLIVGPALLLCLSSKIGALLGLAFMSLLAMSTLRQQRTAPPILVLQLVIQMLCLGATIALVTGLGGDIRPRAGIYITACLLALLLPRQLWETGRRGLAVDLGFGLVALMGMGRAVDRWQFGVGVFAYIVLASITALSQGGLVAEGKRFLRARVLGLGGASVVAALVMGGLAWALPAAEPAVTEALRPYIYDESVGMSGFGDGDIELGHMSEILTSQEVVMRVYGRADHVRGKIYTDYRGGRWFAGSRVEPPPLNASEGRIELGGRPHDRVVRFEAEPEAGHALFAPLGTQRLIEGPPGTVLDAFGLLEVPAKIRGDAREWTVGIGAPDAQRVAAPNERDLKLPRGLRKGLRRIAQRYTLLAETDQERVAGLRRALHGDEFTYTLKPGRVHMRDPVINFLTRSKKGHCEYFASAFVLLARSVDVPARLVAGYRVFELNPAGGYYMVRQRDAHAWAEAFVDGRWVTVEATPAGALEGEQQAEAGWWEARLDLLRRAFSAAFERLAALTAIELFASVVLVAALTLLWVFIRRRREQGVLLDPEGGFAPLELLERHVGQPRPRHQPLLRYAKGLDEGGHQRAAELVRACAALLYGRRGDAQRLQSEIEAFVRGPRA